MEEITGIIKGYHEDNDLYNQFMMSLIDPIKKGKKLKNKNKNKTQYRNIIKISKRIKRILYLYQLQ